MGKVLTKKHKRGIFDDVKRKLVDIALDYAKKNIENSKKEIAGYIEERIRANIEKRVKKELRRYALVVFSLTLLLVGLLVFLYSLFGIVGSLYEIPGYLINLAYSLVLVLIGTLTLLIFA